MPASRLPHTGYCHWCGAATDYVYCDSSCGDSYNMYRRRHPGEQIEPNHPKPQKKAVRYTAIKTTQEQIKERIERIAQRAAENGTLGWATLAPQ